MQEIEVEVISVSLMTDVESGEIGANVAFGKVVNATPEVRERVAASGQNDFPGKITINRAVIFFPTSKSVPYKIGSEWTLKYDGTGGIEIKEKK